MSIDLNITRSFNPKYSVIGDDSENVVDRNTPMAYTQWLENLNIDLQPGGDLSKEYSKYLSDWKKQKTQHEQISSRYIINKYKSALRNIAVNYTTDEQKRFLKNLDYDNPRHVESAITFFASKLKETSLFYAEERQAIRNQRNLKSNIGTKQSLQQAINVIVPKLAQQQKVQRGGLKTASGSSRASVVTTVTDLYDVEPVDPRDNTIEYDPNIFIDAEAAVRQLMIECVPVLELSSELGISLGASDSDVEDDITLLNYSNFYNYTKEADNLNLYKLAEFIPRLVGNDVMFLSGGEVFPMITAETPWRNIFNRSQPAITNNKSKLYKSKYNLGTLNLPDNLGILTYYGYNPTLMYIDPEFTGTVPDPSLYGPSVFSGSKQGVIDQIVDVTWFKADSSNDRMHGDVANVKTAPKFFGYRSDEEIKQTSKYGLSRWIDPVQFFGGEKNKEWANQDVFPQEAHNIFRIDERQEYLNVTDETPVEWSSDLFGNEYSLLKRVTPIRDPLAVALDDEPLEAGTECVIIDGGDTLGPRPRPYTDKTIDYEYYDGGRTGGIDPKTEQSPRMLPFPDIRREKYYRKADGTLFKALEPFNSFYDGPNATRTELIPRTPITYHGFRPDPLFDTQSYGGLFTDETCGVENPGGLACDIQDNYVFGVFSDGISGQGEDIMHVSLPQTLEKVISGGDIVKEGDLIRNNIEQKTNAKYSATTSEYVPIADTARAALLIYDLDTSDAITASFKGNVLDIQSLSKYIEIQTTVGGRDMDVTLKSNGTLTLREMAIQHNNENEIKLDLDSITGGGVRPKSGVEIKLTGSGYVIKPDGLSLTLKDNSTDSNIVTFIADNQTDSYEYNRTNKNTYRYGTKNLTQTTEITRSLTNAITSANTQGDLNISATHIHDNEYREVILLAQSLTGSSGNTAITGTAITDTQAFIQSVSATTITTTDENGVITDVQVIYDPCESIFRGGFEGQLEIKHDIGLAAENFGEIGNEILLNLDLIDDETMYSMYNEPIPSSYSMYNDNYTDKNNQTHTLGLTSTKPGGVTFTVYGNSLSSLQQLLRGEDYMHSGDLSKIPKTGTVIKVAGGVTSPDVHIQSTEKGPSETHLIGDGVSKISQLIAGKKIKVVSGSADTIVAKDHVIEIVGGEWPKLSTLVEAWNSKNPNNRVLLTDGNDTKITSSMQLQLTGGIKNVTYTVPSDPSNEAFDVYCNEQFEEFNPDVGFTLHGNDDPEGVILLRGILDGESFASECANIRGEFVYNVDNTVELYDDVLEISKTEYADYDEDDVFTPLTLYQENFASIGRGMFRSYNSKRIDSMFNFIDPIIKDYSLFEDSDFDQFRTELAENKIRSMQTYCDVQMIETEKFIFFMKMNFDPVTSNILPPGYPIVVVRTTNDDNIKHTAIRPYYDSNRHLIIFGFTETDNTRGITYPRLFQVDLNTMLFKQTYPLPGNDIDRFEMSGELEGYDYKSIDRPVICFNEYTNLHTVTYSCNLINEQDKTVHGICTSDFEIDPAGMALRDVYMYHSLPVPKFVKPGEEWEEEMIELDYQLEPNDYWIPTPQKDKWSTYRGKFELADGFPGSTVTLSAEEPGDFEYTVTGNSLSSLSELISAIPVVLADGDGTQIMGEWDSITIEGGHVARGDQDVLVTQSVSSTIGRLLSSFELTFNLSTKNVPTNGTEHRVNRLMFDPGDGGEIQVNDRIIASGLESLSFDINELPDQSDLYDPRRFGFTHKYTFDDSSNTTTVATLTAVYNTFRKLVYKINIERDKFTIDSGFKDLKLIDTQTIITEDNQHKQVFVLETQRPRYVSHVSVNRKNYTNANVVGYVDGQIYAGDYHVMSDGTLMTGSTHTPVSREIQLTPQGIDVGLNTSNTLGNDTTYQSVTNTTQSDTTNQSVTNSTTQSDTTYSY